MQTIPCKDEEGEANIVPVSNAAEDGCGGFGSTFAAKGGKRFVVFTKEKYKEQYL